MTHPLHGVWGCTMLYNNPPSPQIMGLYNIVQQSTLSVDHGVVQHCTKTHPPWVLVLYNIVQQLTPSMGDGVVQHCTTADPLHGSWGCTTLYKDSPPWVMGLYNVVQQLALSMGDGVVQHCTTTHPLHGSWGCTMLYNCVWAPWVMRPMITLEKYIID